MEDFNEKYERVEVDGVTKFRYRKPSWVPDWLRTWAGEDPYSNMTPAQINKIRREQGKQPYSRSEFETFGIHPAGPRRVPLKGYDEPASSGLSPDKVKELQQAANDARKAGGMSDIRGSETPGSSVPAPAKQDTPKQNTPKEEPKVEQPKPTLDQQYKAARAAKDFTKADELGKRIWAKKYSTPDGGSKFKTKGVDVSTGIQNKMFKAIRDDKLDQAVFKRAQRIGAPMEAYDVVLDYLLSEGHAETVEEAHYVMMQMDAEYIQSIVEKFPDVKGTLNPWESPTTGKSGVKYVTDPKTGKPTQIRNPLYKGV